MRIRTIKPEFWQDEDLSSLKIASHMLAAALLNWADDEGFFKANPTLIKGQCFPLREDLDIRRGLDELSHMGYIELFLAADGKEYGRIVKFLEHQKIDRPSRSKISHLYEGGEIRRGLVEASSLERKGKEVYIYGAFAPHAASSMDTYTSPYGVHNNHTPAPAGTPTLGMPVTVGALPLSASTKAINATPPKPAGKGKVQGGKAKTKTKATLDPLHAQIIALYNHALPELPAIMPTRWTGSTRERALQARISEDPAHASLAFWQWFFCGVRCTPYWLGTGKDGWRADMAWLLRRDNFDKAIERFVGLGEQVDQEMGKRFPVTSEREALMSGESLKKPIHPTVEVA